LPEDYARVLEKAVSCKIPLLEAEEAELGATHAQVGAYLLGLWGLPAPVVEAVALHHQPALATLRALSSVVIVHVADALASAGEKGLPERQAPQLDSDCLETLGLANRVEHWRELCLSEPEFA
ncbi:MAG: HDOD domain-containing protein, partial [Limisphaerales bacterium]